MSTINHKFIKAIETTDNPLAPIIMQETYTSIKRTGRMFSAISNSTDVSMLFTRLLKDFPDQELEKLSVTPEFIMCLCGMLNQSLLGYARSL